MATITVRLSDELESDATEVAEYYGFDLGSLTRAFYTQMVHGQSGLGKTRNRCSIRASQAMTHMAWESRRSCSTWSALCHGWSMDQNAMS